MSNYKNSVIYKICCKDENISDCYVGSSYSHISRKSQHKSICNNEKSDKYNLPVYRYIRDNGGWDNWEFVLLEEYPCDNKNQLVIRERYWFELLGAKLNSYYPQITEEEKKEYNKEYNKEYHKHHYEKNKEKKLEYHKQWRENNKEKKQKQDKEYRKKNKKEISEKRKQKVECPCGSIVRKDYLSIHKRTQKHQNYLKKLSEEEKDN